jgi:hypothetical protein
MSRARLRASALILVTALAACDDSSPAHPDFAAPADLSTADARGASPVGGPCASASDCAVGGPAVCWARNYLNVSSNLAARGGYCTAECTSDADCGDGVCIDEGSDGKWCMAKCQAAADCRSGYACFTRITGHCFPSGGLTCDPAAGDGSCTIGGRAGGCIRSALGTGNTGRCLDGCNVGAGTCPVAGGVNRQCVVLDRTPSGDQWKGPVCVTAYSKNADGAECLSGTGDFIDACIDGEECLLQSLFTGGDNRCHRLCVQGAVDGGVNCASGTCSDVWHLFGTARPIGLCK